MLLIPYTTSAVEGADILGYWVTEGGGSCVEIVERKENYFAIITALRAPYFGEGEVEGMGGKPRTDIHNPDKALRDQPVIGLELMRDFTFTGSQWVNGRIYDPENGKTYRCKMMLKEGGILNVRGYVGIPAFGRTTVWMRPEAYEKEQQESLDFACPSPSD
jgi:uncharacterized protein (DUF2147 family)